MKYALEITIKTDGDVCFPAVPCKMVYDGEEEYRLEREFCSEEDAISSTTKILEILKDNMYAVNAYAKNGFYSFINSCMEYLPNCNMPGGIYLTIGGNYEGTFFSLKKKKSYFDCSFYVEDDAEYEKLIAAYPSIGDVRKTLLDNIKKED